MNGAITERALGVVRGDPLLDEVEAGWCLQGVRLVVEAGLGWDGMEFYRRYGVKRTTQGAEGRTNWSWWAADIEASMKELDLAVPETDRRPGDLVFRHKAAQPYGHVGLYIPGDLVLEVVDPAYRPASMSRAAVCLTRFGYWDPTLIARLG